MSYLLALFLFLNATNKLYTNMQGVAWLNSILLTFLCLLLSALAADFVSGLVHWLADTYGETNWPLIGPTLIFHFRNHHTDPNSILTHNFSETNLSALTFSSVISLCFLNFNGYYAVFATWLCLFTGFTNQFHKWAHSNSTPILYFFLASKGLVLNRTRHMIHHCDDHDKSYCITLGWLNRWLDTIFFFKKIEKLIFFLFQTKPRNY